MEGQATPQCLPWARVFPVYERFRTQFKRAGSCLLCATRTLVYAAASAARTAADESHPIQPSNALATRTNELIMQGRLVRRPPINAPAGSMQCRAHPAKFAKP